MAGAGKEKLRALIADEVARWTLDHRRGLHPYDLSEPDLVAERAYRNLAGYGPLEPLLDDDDVWEVMVNAPDAIFVKRHRGTSGYHDEVFHDDDHVLRTLTKILDDASTSHRKLDASEGLQDAQLDNGARLHIVHGDISRGGHVMVNIRKFTGVAFRNLDQLVERDMLPAVAAAFLAGCVRARQTIVVAGAPGSGKTTLMSCCAAELDPSLRVVVAEEVFEADVPLGTIRKGVCSPRPPSPRLQRPGRPGPTLRQRPVTTTGICELMVVPLPNRPESLLPQHLAVPLEGRAHVWLAPAVMAMAPLRKATTTGIDELTMVPLPNWPELLAPQHLAVPSESKAHVWAQAAVMAVAPLRPVTTTGICELMVVPLPNRPELLAPQHLAVPLESRAHVWYLPAVMAVAPLRPVTTTGVDELMVVPLPNWP